MSKPYKMSIKYVIVHDDGIGRSEFTKLFLDGWGIIFAKETGGAVHYLMRDNPPAEKDSNIVVLGSEPLDPRTLIDNGRSEP